MSTITGTRQLQVASAKNFIADMTVDEISLRMDTLDRHPLDEISWPLYDYKPEVAFAIAHREHELFLKYYVKENNVRVVHREINDTVHKDSCVEIFIGFEEDAEYYNYEFNCLGVCSAGFGAGRHHRKEVPEGILRKIKAKTVLESVCDSGKPSIYWELTLVLPSEVFHFHQLRSWTEKVCRGNFYKCGDDLPQAHFLSWNSIASEHPDFHRPESFGTISFE